MSDVSNGRECSSQWRGKEKIEWKKWGEREGVLAAYNAISSRIIIAAKFDFAF